MTTKLKIIMAQLNFTVGDLDGNLTKHIDAIQSAIAASADIIVFPELSLTGYPPEDLLLRHEFINASEKVMHELIPHCQNIYCVVGHPALIENKLYNNCSVIKDGKIVASYQKQDLPNYAIFDERRYFSSGHSSCVVNINSIKVGFVICEDLWHVGPVGRAKAAGAQLIIAPNASPFESDKHEKRVDLLSKRCRDNNVSILYVNNIGGQDELVFDGGSMAVNNKGDLCALANFFTEELKEVTYLQESNSFDHEDIDAPKNINRIYDALVLGLRDYAKKNHFQRAHLGLSGGIDSALTACIAVDALGKDNVKGILLPSEHTSKMSITDAEALAKNLEIEIDNISIKETYKSITNSLASRFKNKEPDFTEENIQSRCRGIILMAISNHENSLLLSTGNRSELAVGYCTLYGDMAGGYSVLKDVPKTLVYTLSNYRNTISNVIPQNSIEREPTAELAPNQKDQDTLPPYPVLDDILDRYINQSQSIEEIVNAGIERSLVEKIIKKLKINQYKRYQAPVGTHIRHQSFGKEWRYPMTNAFKG